MCFIRYILELPNFALSLTIDRIDNNRGYERGNLRWATNGQQMRNNRHTVLVEYAGEKICLKDFVAKYCAITYNYARQRYARGATLEELIAMPPGTKAGKEARLRFGELRAKESLRRAG